MPITSYKDMVEKKRRIMDSLLNLSKAVDSLNQLGLAIDGSALLDLIRKLKNDNFKVLVIGEFKNGKSTFINALMGEKVLPAYATPCTAVINEVVYGKEKKALLFFKDPLPEEIATDISPEALQHIKKYDSKHIPPMPLEVANLAEYVAIPDQTKDQADSIKESPYSKVVLEYPIELCRDGIELIDSPGLNENWTRTKVTEEYLNQADAILFVFHCSKLASASEIDYITDQIRARGHDDIFFVCNAINLIDEDEQDRVIQFGNQKLSPLTTLGEKGIFYVNALGALKAKQKKNTDELASTGMPSFESALSEYLRNNRGKAKLMQIIIPGKSFIDVLKTQHIKSYIAALDQDVESLEKKVTDALPNLKLAETKKNLIVQKIKQGREDLRKIIYDLIDAKYGALIAEIPKAINDLDIENHMTINPFTQKSKKDALEKEVISKLSHYVEKEMGTWIKTELKINVDSFVDKLKDDIGEDINVFYENLDEFRYEVSGIEKPKDISGFERVTATILGTVLGGPVYGAMGATLGFGEMAKKSAISIGATAGATFLLAFTPMGVATLTTAATAMLIGGGILQIATGGKGLTDKYKNQLKKSFIESLKDGREEGCRQYADNIANDVIEKFNQVTEALDNEIKIEKSKVEALIKDKKDSAADRELKLDTLRSIENQLDTVIQTLTDVGKSIE